MDSSEFRAYIDEARAWLEQRQVALQEEYPLARSRFAGADPSTGTLKFIVDGEEDLVFGYVMIGSWSKAKQTFMWGWGNQTVDEERRKDSERIRELAEITGCELFDRPIFVADPEMAQEMISSSARHLNALGIYRVEQGELRIFFALIDTTYQL